ncbi:MAG: hypothetical protein J4F39_17695 [Candidatus Latescibacteria bacterium]|nr:hypothetical protein [Candidatus Latescibacterota bacterium]
MDVSPGEKLARFIFYNRQFSVMNRVVKFGAFIPPSNSDQISVYRISTLADGEVWAIGREYVETEKRRIKARADFLAQQVYENDLNVIPDTQPHELHANITPFPANKSERQSIARKLALLSDLVLMPTG